MQRKGVGAGAWGPMRRALWCGWLQAWMACEGRDAQASAMIDLIRQYLPPQPQPPGAAPGAPQL